jgi:hypothetical protein
MSSRRNYGPGERAARSRLAQLLHEHELIAGSVVTMARRCGKKGCHCAHGEKHVSLYISTKQGGKRRMIYVPSDLEVQVRRAVGAYRESQELVQTVSEASLARVLQKKRERKKRA